MAHTALYLSATFMKAHDTVNGARSARYVASVASYEELLDGTTGLTYNESDVNGSKGVKKEVSNCEGYFRIKLLPRDENIIGGTAIITLSNILAIISCI
jgi:hypothetical protein